MAGIRELDITYGLNLAPAGFRKVCAEDGSPRALFTSTTDQTNVTYLWVSLMGNSLPITDIAIKRDGDPVPEGFEVLGKNICRGATKGSYLCFRRSESKGAMNMLTFLIVSHSICRCYHECEDSL